MLTLTFMYVCRYELALEFCGKATLLYQQHYGEKSPVTQRSLDLLTSVYAEVGRIEYEDKISRYNSEKKSETPGDSTQANNSSQSGKRRGDLLPTQVSRRYFIIPISNRAPKLTEVDW